MARLDKWLWAARFFKTRNLSAETVTRGRVQINGQPAKPSREVRVGDRVDVQQGAVLRTVIVRQSSEQRGSATVAQQLFEETPESVELRLQQARERRLNADPSSSLDHGRPTKRDRRKMADWIRWSASVDGE